MNTPDYTAIPTHIAGIYLQSCVAVGISVAVQNVVNIEGDVIGLRRKVFCGVIEEPKEEFFANEKQYPTLEALVNQYIGEKL